MNPDENLFRRQWASTRRPKDQMRDVTKFFRQISKMFDDSSSKPRKKRQPLGPDSFPKYINGLRSQISTVWSNYGNRLHNHLEFLKTYMPQKNKKEVSEKPELFGNIPLSEYEKKASGRHYKWMLSPETVMDKDSLETYTREWMRRYEQFNKVSVNYQAVVHTNTEHPHVHIVINGVSKDGKAFRQSPDFIRVVGRQFSNEILTWMNGERTVEQVRAQTERMPKMNRWTKLDQQLEELLYHDADKKNGGGQIRLDAVPDALRNRLEHLKDLGIASYSDGVMTLEKDWNQTLRSLGRYNTFLDARGSCSIGSQMMLYKASMGNIRGVVRKVYVMDDENVWKNAIVIENTADKKAYFVPLYKPDRKSTPGDLVSLSAELGQKGKLQVVIKKDSSTAFRAKQQEYSKNIDMGH